MAIIGTDLKQKPSRLRDLFYLQGYEVTVPIYKELLGHLFKT